MIKDAKDVLRVMTPGSSYVFNPIHNILPKAVVENIVALYRWWRTSWRSTRWRWPMPSERIFPD